MKLPSLSAVIALTYLSTASAGPLVEERAAEACQSGLYGQWRPVLAAYAPAVSFCRNNFPATCAAGNPKAKRAQDSPEDAAAHMEKRAATTSSTRAVAARVTTSSTTRNDYRQALWNEFLKKERAFVSTLCSCIQNPQNPCSTTTSKTTTTKIITTTSKTTTSESTTLKTTTTSATTTTSTTTRSTTSSSSTTTKSTTSSTASSTTSSTSSTSSSSSSSTTTPSMTTTTSSSSSSSSSSTPSSTTSSTSSSSSSSSSSTSTTTSADACPTCGIQSFVGTSGTATLTVTKNFAGCYSAEFPSFTFGFNTQVPDSLSACDAAQACADYYASHSYFVVTGGGFVMYTQTNYETGESSGYWYCDYGVIDNTDPDRTGNVPQFYKYRIPPAAQRRWQD